MSFFGHDDAPGPPLWRILGTEAGTRGGLAALPDVIREHSKRYRLPAIYDVANAMGWLVNGREFTLEDLANTWREVRAMYREAGEEGEDKLYYLHHALRHLAKGLLSINGRMASSSPERQALVRAFGPVSYYDDDAVESIVNTLLEAING